MKINRSAVTKAILITLAVGGVMSLAVVAPNAVQLLRFVSGFKPKQKSNRTYYANIVLKRLATKGLVKLEKDKFGKISASLTPLGEKEIDRYELDDYQPKKPKRWDKKWRLIIFDIKERRRSYRDELRYYLQKFGFVRLQNSVWVYPYDCVEIVTLLKTNFNLNSNALYITAEAIENDQWLRKDFDLE